MEIPILFEDETLLVIDKPPGLVVNEAETQHEQTLEKWLRDVKQIPVERSGIVHRLDKDTSGVLVVAKNPDALASLQQQFQLRTTEKQYLALVHTILAEKSGEITTNFARNPKNRLKFAVTEEGKEATTAWRVEAYYRLPEAYLSQLTADMNKNQKRYYEAQAIFYTLLTVFPKTGRTHQIRVHLSSLRHPLVSDKVYTSRKLTKLDALWCPRHFLHAQSLAFDHPVTGERMTLTSPLPDDLQQALETLEKSS